MRIDYSKKFIKGLKKSPRKIRIAFRDRLKIFLKDRSDPLLNNHVLSGRYKGYRSINVTGDLPVRQAGWRAIFRELNHGKIIYFDLIGTHSQLYKS